MSGNQTTAQPTRSAPGEVERSTAKTQVALRNGEADLIVEALRWYAHEETAPRKQARCEKVAAMLESGFDI
jgi:hypothetical protein